MAAVFRQPFAPLDGARLQSLTSLKNRQNSIVVNSPGKRKALEVETDDFENVDPTLFSKRTKGGVDNFFPSKDFVKPSAFVLTKAGSAPALPASKEILNPGKAASPLPRTFLQPKSPVAKLNTAIAKCSPLSAPAGRSPTRGSKRIGILSNRRRTTAGLFSRVDPPAFNTGSAAPFSLDAALKGTIPSYSGRASSTALVPSLHQGPEMKDSWFFDIHEDTPEQEMTNLLQHSTCTLDISSDEESEQKARRERAEGRNKENVPPTDDVSQTSLVSAARRMAAANVDDMMVEKTRSPLGEMNAEDYYAKGCDGSSVVLVDGDEEEDVAEAEGAPLQRTPAPVSGSTILAEQEPTLEGVDSYEFDPEPKVDFDVGVDVLMGKNEPAAKAAVLEPIEGTGESFVLWESDSAKDESAPASPAPAPELVDEAVAAC